MNATFGPGMSMSRLVAARKARYRSRSTIALSFVQKGRPAPKRKAPPRAGSAGPCGPELVGRGGDRAYLSSDAPQAECPPPWRWRCETALALRRLETMASTLEPGPALVKSAPHARHGFRRASSC